MVTVTTEVDEYEVLDEVSTKLLISELQRRVKSGDKDASDVFDMLEEIETRIRLRDIEGAFIQIDRLRRELRRA